MNVIVRVSMCAHISVLMGTGERQQRDESEGTWDGQKRSLGDAMC